MPPKPRTVETYPDLSATHCRDVTCTGEISLSDEQFAGLRRFSAKRTGKMIIAGVEFKGASAWNHHTISIMSRDAEPARFAVYMHTYHPSKDETEREHRSRKFYGLLEAISEIAGEIELAASATFMFPAARFSPALVFPAAAGLKIPLSSEIAVRITGLRLSLESAPVDSIMLDVSLKHQIVVATTWTVRMAVNRQLPERCLERASSIADKLVLPIGAGGTSGR